ncbi:MAG TPA: hypothetical protein PKE47_10765, partial [Verrucomicrobiota bacterium]|nr:hypothetical protein [Verrucomicrobiota bacterium]
RLGETLFIVVTDAGGVRAQTAYTVEDRGVVARLDFSQAVSDADGNGLPDAWEIRHFGAAGQNPAAVNANGQTTLQNFIAGTNQYDPQDALRLTIGLAGANSVVSVLGRRAEGSGYEGRSRTYTFEATTNLGFGAWRAVPEGAGLIGGNQAISLIVPLTNPPSAYRVRVSLAGP